MKRNIIQILIMPLLLTMILIHSCDESNLEIKPVAETEAVFYTKEDDFFRSAVGMYAKMTDIYYFNANDPLHPVWLLPGDALTTRGAYPYETFSGMQPSDGRINKYWQRNYQLIARANTMLEKLDEADNAIFITNTKGHYQGEALFVRALTFYNLWNFFGTAPLVTQRIDNINETHTPSSSGTQMLDQAIEDLKEAAEGLPNSWPPEQLGRVTKDAALGLLGKCLVFRGNYTGASQDYSDAVTYVNQISTRDLAPHFGDNFDAEKENNIESLFEFQASNAPSFENIWLWNDFDQAIGPMGAYWGFFNREWSWWAGTPFSATGKLINAFHPHDPRIDETFRTYLPDHDQFANYIVVTPEGEQISNEFRKFVRRGQLGDITNSVNNPRILRYADVLLIKAEALVHSGGSRAEAIGIINGIRERARNSVEDGEPASMFPENYPTTETNDNIILQWIMDERFIELAGEEAHRWFDLKRWHAAGMINLGNWGRSEFGSHREDFNFPNFFNLSEGKMLYPIPTSETDLNPEIQQNPGF